MASRLPAFPRFVFTTFEPISLVGGATSALLRPDWFISQQLGGSPVVLTGALSTNARLVALQLGNAYGLLCLVGLAVLLTTSEPKVVRAYLVALLIADVGHVGLTVHGLGYDKFVDFGAWNAMTWGNVGVTAFLGLTRILYLLGLFGPGAEVPMAGKTK